MKNKFKKVKRKFVAYPVTKDILPIDLKSIDDLCSSFKLE